MGLQDALTSLQHCPSAWHLMNTFTQQYYALGTPLVLLLLALLCVLAWRRNARHRYLLWTAAGYSTLGIGILIQTMLSPTQVNTFALLTSGLYLAAHAALSHSMAQRVGLRAHPAALIAISALTLAGMWWYSAVTPNMNARLVVLSAGVGLTLAHIVPQLLRVPLRHYMEKATVAVYVLGSAASLGRPLLLLYDASQKNEAWLVHSFLWWATSMLVLVLCTVHAVCLLGCVMVDTVHQLREERDRDALTGLLNRRAWTESCGPILYEKGLHTLVFADLDHFKAINDQHGHHVGDQVLQAFGQLLQSNLRERDVLGRIGGEEFVIAMHHKDLAHAEQVVQRIAEKMRTHVWTDLQLQVTSSFGIVHTQPHEALERSMQRADAQLYAAKNAGRDCISSEGTLLYVSPKAAQASS